MRPAVTEPDHRRIGTKTVLTRPLPCQLRPPTTRGCARAFAQGALHSLRPTSKKAESQTDLEVTKFQPEPFFVVARPGHPLTERDEIESTDLAPYSIISPPAPDRILSLFHWTIYSGMKKPYPIFPQIQLDRFDFCYSLLQTTD